MKNLREHKEKWERLAKEDDRYYVRSVDHTQSDEEYEESGRIDVYQHLLSDPLIEQIKDHDRLTILEIGCGSGRMTKTLAKCFEKVYALDISAEMLSKASNFVSSGNVTYIESDGESVPIPACCVDIAFSYIVYQHFPSKQAIHNSFLAVRSALKSGGFFKVQIRGAENPDRGHWAWGPHYSPDEAKELAEQVGFDLVGMSGAGSRSFWLRLKRN